MNTFVGNLNFRTTENQLKELPTPFGNIQSLKIIKGRYSRYYESIAAFIKMPIETETQSIVDSVNNSCRYLYQVTGYEARDMYTVL